MTSLSGRPSRWNQGTFWLRETQLEPLNTAAAAPWWPTEVLLGQTDRLTDWSTVVIPVALSNKAAEWQLSCLKAPPPPGGWAGAPSHLSTAPSLSQQPISSSQEAALGCQPVASTQAVWQHTCPTQLQLHKLLPTKLNCLSDSFRPSTKFSTCTPALRRRLEPKRIEKKRSKKKQGCQIMKEKKKKKTHKNNKYT